MRRTIRSAGIGTCAGGAVGFLIAIGGILVDPNFANYLWRLVAVDTAIGAYAGVLIGGLSERTQAGGGYLRPAARIGLCLGAAILLARLVFDVRSSLSLMVWGTAGALAGGRPRPLQFSLKSLMAFTVIASLALAAFVSGPLKEHRLTERSVACGGRVQYAAKTPGWAVDLLGEVSRHWFDHVTELQLFDASDADIPRLRSLEHLERMGLGGAGLTDRGLRQLAPMNRLKSLELHDLPSISGDGLQCLPELTGVEELWLGGLRFGDRELEQVQRMPQLRKLSLYHTSITDSGIAAIDDLTNLEELSIDWAPKLTGASFRSIGRLKKLKVLRVHVSSANDLALKNLKSLDKLECLELSAQGITGLGFQRLESLDSLRRLKVWGYVSDDGLEAIARLNRLKMLEFGGHQVTDEGLASLAALEHLESLSFHGTSVTDDGLEHLKALRKLKSLDIHSFSISEAAVNQLRADMLLVEGAR